MSSAEPKLPDPAFKDPAIQTAYNKLQPALKQLFRAGTKESEKAQMDILENMTPVPLPLPDVLDRTKTTPNYPPMMWLGYRIHDRDVRQVWHNYYADSTVSRKTIDKDYDKCSEKLATVLRWAEHDSQEEWKTLWGCKKFTMIQCGLGYPNSDMWLVSVVDSWDWSGLSDKGRRAILRDVECVKKLLGQEGDPHWYLGIESTWWMQPQEIDRVKRMARRR